MAFSLTKEQKEKICHAVNGTCMSEHEIQNHFPEIFGEDDGDDHTDTILECLADGEVGRCDCCSWWVESNELDENGYCEDCQENN